MVMISNDLAVEIAGYLRRVSPRGDQESDRLHSLVTKFETAPGKDLHNVD